MPYVPIFTGDEDLDRIQEALRAAIEDAEARLAYLEENNANQVSTT